MTDRTHDRPDDHTHDHADADADQYGTRLATGLTALADAPAPPSRLDTAWAIRTGRSRLRRRRAGVLGAVAAVVLGVSLVGAVLPSGDQDTWTTRTADGAPGLPRFGPVTGDDAMTINVTFGWLPAGFDQYSYTVTDASTPSKRSIMAYGQKLGNGNPFNPQISLHVYSPDEKPPVPDGNVQTHLIKTTPVNGHPAYWLGSAPDTPTGPGGQRTLRFRTPDGRWADLTSVSLDQVALEELLPRVAAGVRTGRKTASLPFTLKGVPAGYRQTAVYFDVGPVPSLGLPWVTHVDYALGDAQLSIEVRPDVEPDPEYGPQQDSQFPPAELPKACKSQEGLRLCVQSTDGPAPFAAAGGLQGWLDRVTGLGTDPAGWTVDFVR